MSGHVARDQNGLFRQAKMSFIVNVNANNWIISSMIWLDTDQGPCNSIRRIPIDIRYFFAYNCFSDIRGEFIGDIRYGKKKEKKLVPVQFWFCSDVTDISSVPTVNVMALSTHCIETRPLFSVGDNKAHFRLSSHAIPTLNDSNANNYSLFSMTHLICIVMNLNSDK